MPLAHLSVVHAIMQYACAGSVHGSDPKLMAAALQASEADAPQRRQDAARQNQKAGSKHERRRLVQRPDLAASAGPSSAMTQQPATTLPGRLHHWHTRNHTKRLRALGILQPGLPQCLAQCQILKVIRAAAL